MAAIDDQVGQALQNLTKLVESLKEEVSDLRNKVEGGKGSDKESKKGSDSDLALALALMPLCGIMPFGLGTPVLLPFGLRLAAARVLMLHRALERAARITGELAKERDDRAETRELVEQFFKGVASADQKGKDDVAKLLRAFWRQSASDGR